MWIKPLVTCFLPQALQIRSTVTMPFKPGRTEEGMNPDNKTLIVDDFPTDDPLLDPWEGREMVESDGNYLDAAFLESGPLYANQGDLPYLPVPKLKDTVKRFLPTALPLAATEDEKLSLERACEDFESQAQILQERLEARFAECKEKNTSWLQEYWQKGAYLQCRDALPFFISYYFLLNDPDEVPPLWESTADAGIVKAAALLRAAVEYADQVTSGLKEPDVIGKKKTPLCSSGYKYLFNSCRVPQLGADVSRLYNPGMHKHAIVACGGNFYSIPIKDKEGKPLNRLELEDLLYQCEESSITIDKDPLELGWLTAWNRDKWARAREFLLQRAGPEMAEALETIESSLIMINLDVDVTAESVQDQADNFWRGQNRWWDKTIQLYVTRNGQWSYLGEHSMVDGLVPVPFCEYLLNEAKFSSSATGDETVLSLPGPTAVNVFQNAFAALSEYDTEQVQKLVADAKSDFLKQANDLEMHVNEFTSFGSDFIKKTGSSADAFAQMAIQLASFRMVGKYVATYESTNTREYLHGRTEATRSVSTGSVAFCEAMGAKPKMDRSPEERLEILKLLQQAAFKHSFYSKKASMGHGVDRHFFGLTQMIKDDEETPDLFKHPVFERSKHFRLSTSSLPTCPGFGMVVDDGLGVGYGVYENKLVFNIAAKRDTGYAQTFDKLLSEALEEMATLV